MRQPHIDDFVRLTQDIPELSLNRGAVGVVRSTWFAPTVAYEVEFHKIGHDYRAESWWQRDATVARITGEGRGSDHVGGGVAGDARTGWLVAACDSGGQREDAISFATIPDELPLIRQGCAMQALAFVDHEIFAAGPVRADGNGRAVA